MRSLELNTRIALLRAFFLILVILAIGTSGYSVIEGWTLLESLYMTMITITTIGSKEVRPLGPDGQTVFNPGPSALIDAGDTLIAMGEVKSLKTLDEKASTS